MGRLKIKKRRRFVVETPRFTPPPVVPGNLQTAIFKANEVLGRREVNVDISLWNLKQVIHRESKLLERGQPMEKEAAEMLYCMALLADENGRFSGSNDQVIEAVSWLQPQIQTLVQRLGALAKCLLAGDANSPERLAEMERLNLKEWLDVEDCQFLSWLVDRPWEPH